MGKTVNSVSLLGNVGKDPVIRTTSGGAVVADFSIATVEGFKGKDGWKEQTTWHGITVFGKTAEIVRDYVKKGSKVFVMGRISNESWQDKQSGQTKERTKIIANEVVLCGERAVAAKQAQASSSSPSPSFEASDDDIPF